VMAAAECVQITRSLLVSKFRVPPAGVRVTFHKWYNSVRLVQVRYAHRENCEVPLLSTHDCASPAHSGAGENAGSATGLCIGGAGSGLQQGPAAGDGDCLGAIGDAEFPQNRFHMEFGHPFATHDCGCNLLILESACHQGE
jgi:hypothetical protein